MRAMGVFVSPIGQEGPIALKPFALRIRSLIGTGLDCRSLHRAGMPYMPTNNLATLLILEAMVKEFG